MTDPDLQDALNSALRRLEHALEARLSRSAPTVGMVSAADTGEIESLRARLLAAEAEIERLQGALDQANARRSAALKKVDQAVGQVDDLLSALEPEVM